MNEALPPARDRAVMAARVADHEQGRDILLLEVGAVTIIAEYFVIASAPNRRLVARIAEEVEARVAELSGERPVRVEGTGTNEWVVIDYGDLMVHVFLDETREFYEIERLYADVPHLEWADPDAASAEAAGEMP